MIYHVSYLLYGSATTLIRLEADSFYVDEGMIIFTRESMDNSSRLASFPVQSVRWVVGENLVHGTTFYPQADMVPLPVIDNEDLVRARDILRHAPAIMTQDSIAPRVPAFPSSEGRLSTPHFDAAMEEASSNSVGLSRGTFGIDYGDRAAAAAPTVPQFAPPPMRGNPVGFGSANQQSLTELLDQHSYHSIRPSLNTDAEYRL